MLGEHKGARGTVGGASSASRHPPPHPIWTLPALAVSAKRHGYRLQRSPFLPYCLNAEHKGGGEGQNTRGEEEGEEKWGGGEGEEKWGGGEGF